MVQGKKDVGHEDAQAAESDSPITMLIKLITTIYRLVFSSSREVLAINQDGQILDTAGREFKNQCERHWFKENKSLPQNREFTQARLTVELQTLEGDNEVVLVDDNYHLTADVAYFSTNDGQQVRVTAREVAEVPASDSKVVFTGRRSGGFAKLGDPIATLMDLLRSIVRLDDEELVLFIGCILKAFMPGQNPVMIIAADQGSGKSFLAKIFQLIVDPAGSGKRVRILDNLSGIGDKLSDELCRESANRTTIITTINPGLLNQDLVDRTILFSLLPIPKNQRKTEYQLLQELNANLGDILLIITQAIREVLSNRSKNQANYPRLADFYHTCISAASCGHLGFNDVRFRMALDANQFYSVERSLNDNPVSAAIMELMDKQEEGAWIGTATELLAKLNKDSDDDLRCHSSWPSRANKLSAMLHRAAPFLREKGVVVCWDKNGQRTITITVQLAENEHDNSDIKIIQMPAEQIQEEPILIEDASGHPEADGDTDPTRAIDAHMAYHIAKGRLTPEEYQNHNGDGPLTITRKVAA